MDRGNINPTQHFHLMAEGNHEKYTNHFGQHRDLNSELCEYEFSVMNFDRRYALCIQKFYTDRTSQSAGARIGASNFNLWNDANVRSPASAIVMRRHYSITYRQLLYVINNLLAAG